MCKQYLTEFACIRKVKCPYFESEDLKKIKVNSIMISFKTFGSELFIEAIFVGVAIVIVGTLVAGLFIWF